MRLVLDTNVLIAAFVARGVCHEVLEHCARRHGLVTSDKTMGEFEEKLLNKFKVPHKEVRQAIDLLSSQMQSVTPKPLAVPVCRDADDDWVLATAAVGECACIVTGDKDLLVLESFQNTIILAPAAFWAYEAAHSS
ncbi:putative toxin-antitoxin system toxin component, PIN family [soil metagenome]